MHRQLFKGNQGYGRWGNQWAFINSESGVQKEHSLLVPAQRLAKENYRPRVKRRVTRRSEKDKIEKKN